jgi:hypothetical protein
MRRAHTRTCLKEPTSPVFAASPTPALFQQTKSQPSLSTPSRSPPSFLQIHPSTTPSTDYNTLSPSPHPLTFLPPSPSTFTPLQKCNEMAKPCGFGSRFPGLLPMLTYIFPAHQPTHCRLCNKDFGSRKQYTNHRGRVHAIYHVHGDGRESCLLQQFFHC